MSILDLIVSHKYGEVEQLKSIYPPSVLEKSPYFNCEVVSLKDSLLRKDHDGIIAEFKRRSPSKGILNNSALPGVVCSEYVEAGCSAVSILTDSEYFGGSSADISEVRKRVGCPILRKDFIVDEYQIIEAKSIGADAILLIAELHSAEKLETFHRFAYSLGLEVLVEFHNVMNLSKLPSDAQIIGINSRNLESFEVDLDHLSGLIHLLPGNILKVAESGIKTDSDYITLKNAGFDAFLIGELFMRNDSPGIACRNFISQIRKSPDFSIKMKSDEPEEY